LEPQFKPSNFHHPEGYVNGRLYLRSTEVSIILPLTKDFKEQFGMRDWECDFK